MAHRREASAQKCDGRSDPDNRRKWRSSESRIAEMILLLALQLTIGTAQLPGPGQYAVTPEQHYENAKQDFAERKFTEADTEVNAALHATPYMVPALFLKARLATFAHRPDVANNCLITPI